MLHWLVGISVTLVFSPFSVTLIVIYQLQLRRPRREVLRLDFTADLSTMCLMSTVGLAVAMDTMIDLRFLSKLESCLVYSCSITLFAGLRRCLL